MKTGWALVRLAFTLWAVSWAAHFILGAGNV